MTRDWSVVEAAAQLLDRDEREAVLGDLLEAGESAWRGLIDVVGLVVRRAGWTLEELAALGRGVWTDFAWELVVDGYFHFG
jgi:hypothetical protein